jgi:predicted type IV restriction endonuclease
LGFDRFVDLAMEYRVRQQFADYGLKIDGELVAFVEVKRVAQKLTESHLDQVLAYAVNHGLAWMLLINGQVWQAYHRSDATIGSPVTVDLFLTVDLLDSQISLGDKVNKLFYLTKESFKRKLIDELWRQQAATSPKALTSAILSGKVVNEIRLELRRHKAPNIEVDELTDVIRETVLRTELTEAGQSNGAPTGSLASRRRLWRLGR